MKLRTILKQAIQPLRSLFGSNSSELARPMPGGIVGGLLGWIREPFSGAWQAGETPVDPLGALTCFGAVYACVSKISNDIAKLCPQLMAQLADGRWEPADPAAPHWKVLRRPNGFQNRIQFIAYWLTCKLLHGNAYALKARDGRGMVGALYLLDPRRVFPLVTPDGDVYYSLGGDDLSKIPQGMVVPASEIIHDRLNCLWHPLVGVSPIIACAVSVTQGRRIQSNSAKFFENMSRPSGVLTAPGTIDPTTAKRLKEDFEKNFAGQNIGRLAVLGDGLKYEAMVIPPETAQLIEQLKWTVEDVGRAFGMPLYKINAGQIPANTTVEALNQQYYDDCLQPHIEALELALDEGLYIPDRMCVEMDLDGLLRMDKSAQMTMLGDGVKNTILKPNEARKRLNLPPVDGGDTLYLQQQNYSLAALAKRDASADPFGKNAAAPALPAPSPAPTPAPGKDMEAEAAVLIETFTKGLEHV